MDTKAKDSMTVDELRSLLAPRQLEALTFIYRFWEQHSYSPTLREIGAALDIRSTNGVFDHLRALKRKGFLSREPMKSRTIVLTCAGYEAIEGRPTFSVAQSG